MPKSLIIAVLFLSPLLIYSQSTVTLDSTVLTEREVAVGLDVPWEILWGPDDHIWVTEKVGRVLRIEPESGMISESLDLESQVLWDSEPGLLGMTLHSNFENEPKVFLVYTYSPEGFEIRERLVVFDWDGSQLINEVVLLDNLPAGGIHNGSRLLISNDNKILMTTGDKGESSLSQNDSSLNGKLLRLNLDGSIPDDNPDPSSYIYTKGHRNAQGLAYGPKGNLYSSEHGAQQSDEFNIIEAGRNYGWPTVQGECNTTVEQNFCNQFNVMEPLTEWSPCIAVNGIEYYNHDAIPEWKGKMLMAVLGGLGGGFQRISVLSFDEDGTSITGEKSYFTQYGRLRDICTNPYNGAIYLATNGPGYPSSGPNRIIEYRNVDFTSSSDDHTICKSCVDIYPNPTINEEMVIKIPPILLNATARLFSIDGKETLSAKLSSAENIISVSDIETGIYYIRIALDGRSITKSIFINR